MASLFERTATRVVVPLVVAVFASAGVALARHNPDKGAAIVAVVAVLAVVCALVGERGAALAAIGVGAAASFAVPDGLGPLLAVTGVILSGEVGLVDRHLARWRYLVDAVVCLPALGGLAATIAAQPSVRAVALGAATLVAIFVTLWRNRVVTRPRFAASPVAYVAALAAVVVVLAPDRVTALGDLPPASVTAARSLAAGLAIFVLALVVDSVWAQRRAFR